MIQLQSEDLPPSNQFSLEINLTNNNNNNNNLYFQESFSLVDNKIDIFKCLSSPKNSVKNTEFNFFNNFTNNDQAEDENLDELFENQSEHKFQQSFCFQNIEKTQCTQKEQKIESSDIELQPNNEEDFIDPNGAFFEFPDFDEHEKEQKIQVSPKLEKLQNQQKQQQQQIWKVTQSISKKKKQRDYDKNICRYIARSIVRCFVDKTYKSEVMEFCEQFLEEQNMNTTKNKEKLYDSATKFLLSKIEFITGHRAFRSILCFDEDFDKKSEKCVFRNFTYWFLKERAFRYIMTGAMSDKKSYLKFKNEIMMIYVRKPESWDSNLKIQRNRRN